MVLKKKALHNGHSLDTYYPPERAFPSLSAQKSRMLLGISVMEQASESAEYEINL